MLRNAVKYRYKHADERFVVRIISDATPSHFLVHFDNWGPPIDRLEAEDIFLPGRRGANAVKYDATGHGFGLAISRDIMQSHGGNILLTSLDSPVRFTLEFPRFLAHRKPR